MNKEKRPVQISVNAELWERLREMATRKRRSASAQVEVLIEEAVAKEKEEQ